MNFEFESYENFMQQLSNEDWEESKSRLKPDLPNFTHDINNIEITYKGDVTVKPVNVELPLVKSGKYKEITQEIVHCFNNPLYTMKNYFKIIHPDRGIIPFELYDYQVEYIQDCFRENRLLVKWPRQSGKCVVGDTKIKVRTKTKNKFKLMLLNLFNENGFLMNV